jgi:hypothetical protein
MFLSSFTRPFAATPFIDADPYFEQRSGSPVTTSRLFAIPDTFRRTVVTTSHRPTKRNGNAYKET